MDVIKVRNFLSCSIIWKYINNGFSNIVFVQHNASYHYNDYYIYVIIMWLLYLKSINIKSYIKNIIIKNYYKIMKKQWDTKLLQIYRPHQVFNVYFNFNIIKSWYLLKYSSIWSRTHFVCLRRYIPTNK